MIGTILAERQLDAPAPSLTSSNQIHTDAGARSYGFANALVGGITVFGFAVPVLLEAVGDRWLSDGWIDLKFRRPVYPGEHITIRAIEVDRCGEGALRIGSPQTAGAMLGTFGIGEAPWAPSFAAPPYEEPRGADERRPRLQLDSAPVGQALRAFAPELGPETSTEINSSRWGASDERFTGQSPLVHPATVALQGVHLLKNSFRYGRPAVHTRSQLQFIAPAPAEPGYVLTGRLVDAWAEGGDHYAQTDGALYRADGTAVARIRHTNIFQLAHRG